MFCRLYSKYFKLFVNFLVHIFQKYVKSGKIIRIARMLLFLIEFFVHFYLALTQIYCTQLLSRLALASNNFFLFTHSNYVYIILDASNMSIRVKFIDLAFRIQIESILLKLIEIAFLLFILIPCSLLNMINYVTCLVRARKKNYFILNNYDFSYAKHIIITNLKRTDTYVNIALSTGNTILFMWSIEKPQCCFFYNLNQQNTTMKEQYDFPQPQHNSFRIKARGSKQKPYIVNHYQIFENIGQGGFASVHRAVELHTNTDVAVKIVNLEGLSSKDYEHLRRQIFIHKQLSHPNIIKIYQFVQTKSYAYIFMELVKGFELFDYLTKHGRMYETTAAKVFSQIVSAVKYIHSHNISHRDIKTQNILIDKQFNAKLIDFGLAKMFQSQSNDYLETFCGSPSYVAPQLLSHQRYSGQKIDVWCLGVTLFVMLEACLPFDDCDKNRRENNIKNYCWHQPLFSSPQAQQIYKNIFQKDRFRYTIEDLLNQPFLTNCDVNISLNKSKLPSKGEEGSNNFSQIVHLVSNLLNVEEAQVKSVVQNGQLGEIFSVYHILLKKVDRQQRKLSRSEQKIVENIKREYKTLQPKSQKRKSRERPKSRHEQNIFKVFPVINDGNAHKNVVEKNEKDATKINRHAAQIHHNYFDLEIQNKDDIIKETIKIKASKFRNIFSKDLMIKQAKPRLRDDSPDSPKRILNCLKRYN